MEPLSGLQLPPSMRDPAFLRREQVVRQMEAEGKSRPEIRGWAQRNPLIADRPFDPNNLVVICPMGHRGEHVMDVQPHNIGGVPHRARNCAVCSAGWYERIEGAA